MKIVQQYIEDGHTAIVEVISAEYLGDYRIEISFNDGKNHIIDFKSFLKKSLHPSISKYLNEELFSQFKIENGNLNWNDYDLIFPLDELHKGVIS